MQCGGVDLPSCTLNLLYVHIERRTIEMSMECLCIYRSFECVEGVADEIQSNML